MKKVLILMAVLTVMAFAVPAMAYPVSDDPTYSYWQTQWFTGFDFTALTPVGPLANKNVFGAAYDGTGNDGWVSPMFTSGTDNSGTIVATPLALSAGNVFKPGPGGSSTSGYANSRNMKVLNGNGVAYDEGYVRYWMYDPRGTGTATETDTRGWVGSPAFNPASTLTSSSFTWGATLGDSRANGKTNWVFAMGGTFIDATGTGATTAGGAGGGLVFTRVAGRNAIRSLGWHEVVLYWNFTPVAGRMEFYVDDMITPAVVGDMTSINSRWANFKGGVGSLYIGNTQGVTTKAGLIDEVSFYGRPAPEPSSMMALGAGVMGLLGLIRRRK